MGTLLLKGAGKQTLTYCAGSSIQIARGEAAQDLDQQNNGCRGKMRANPRQPLRYLKTPKERAGVSGFIRLGDSQIKPPEQFRDTVNLGLNIVTFKTQPNTVS